MAITFSNHGGLNDENWKVIDTTLSAVMQDTDTEKNKEDELVKSLFAVKTSKKFGEKKGSMTEFGNFEIVGEGDSAVEDSLQMGFSKLIEHEQMIKGFSCTRQAKDDGDIDIMKAAARNFVVSYKRTRAQFASDALCGEGATFKFGNKLLDRTTGDGKALFATDHPYKTIGGTQSNVFTTGLFDKDSDGNYVYSINNLIKATNVGRNFKNQSGNVQGYTFDTIIVPGNAPLIEEGVKRIIRTDGVVGSDFNDYNSQKGLFKLIVNHRWICADPMNAPVILMSSEAQRDKEASVFYDRVPLDVANEVDLKTRNLEWSGYTRMSAGFYTWDHVMMLGAQSGSVL